MVRPSQVQESASAYCNSCKLGNCVFEYCFQVPANRIGYNCYNAVQLKTIQEVITLTVFAFFSVWYLREEFKWNYLIGFVFIILAVFLFSNAKGNIMKIQSNSTNFKSNIKLISEAEFQNKVKKFNPKNITLAILGLLTV